MDDWDETTKETAKPPFEPRSHRAYLVVQEGANIGSVFVLGRDPVLLGRSRQAGLVLFDDGVSRMHARIVLRNGRFNIEDLNSRNGTFCGGRRIERCVLRHGDLLCLGRRTVLRFRIGDSLDETFQRHMYESAVRDGLTGAFNRRHFVERLSSELATSLRHQTPMSLLLLDLDHFKRVNDRLGHAAGDQTLVDFARRVRELVRADELFARVGGEEFAILATRTDIDAARIAAERIRRETQALEIVFGESRITITVSIGVASFPGVQASTPVMLMAAADSALYQAKRAGRNRVEVFQPSSFDEDTRLP